MGHSELRMRSCGRASVLASSERTDDLSSAFPRRTSSHGRTDHIAGEEDTTTLDEDENDVQNHLTESDLEDFERYRKKPEEDHTKAGGCAHVDGPKSATSGFLDGSLFWQGLQRIFPGFVGVPKQVALRKRKNSSLDMEYRTFDFPEEYPSWVRTTILVLGGVLLLCCGVIVCDFIRQTVLVLRGGGGMKPTALFGFGQVGAPLHGHGVRVDVGGFSSGRTTRSMGPPLGITEESGATPVSGDAAGAATGLMGVVGVVPPETKVLVAQAPEVALVPKLFEEDSSMSSHIDLGAGVMGDDRVTGVMGHDWPKLPMSIVEMDVVEEDWMEGMQRTPGSPADPPIPPRPPTPRTSPGDSPPGTGGGASDIT